MLRPSTSGWRSTAVKIVAAALIVCFSGFTAGQARADNQGPAQADRPNIILILVDDLGCENLGVYGGQSYQTPNLDRLAAQGMRFTQCFGEPLCTPSRAELLTGQYPSHTGVSGLLHEIDTTMAINPKDTPQLGRIMKSAGYATGVFGKWGLANLEQFPNHVSDSGFDEHFLWVRFPRTRNQISRYWNPNILANGQLQQTDMNDYGPNLFYDQLVDFIRRNRNERFFAYYSMILVHGPYVPPPNNFRGKYAKGKRVNSLEDNYADMVAYMDRLIAELVTELESLEIQDNTLILIVGDNGSPMSLTSTMNGKQVTGAKRSLTDLGIHLPMIVYQPGAVPAGRVYEHPVSLADILPTFSEIAQAQLPDDLPPLDGHSFAKQLRGEPGPTRQWTLSQLDDVLCIRTPKWKLLSDGSLFDLVNDPDESHPIDTSTATLSEEASAVVANLKPILQRYKADYEKLQQ